MPAVPEWSIYVQFFFYTFGSISSRFWCGINAVVLLFMQYRSLCFVLKLMPLFVSSPDGKVSLHISMNYHNSVGLLLGLHWLGSAGNHDSITISIGLKWRNTKSET